jgi:hypothetical protein
MAQAITITLPDNLYDKLKRTAALVDEPLEAIVTRSLSQSLSPLLDDIPVEYQADVYPLLQMNSAELQAEIQRVFPAEGWLEYETLLEQKKDRALTPPEQTHLDAFRREADILMFRKGYAAVLLKRRGYQIPSTVDLPRVP